MATLVSAPVRQAADGFVHKCGLKSAVLSGIVPDRAHLKSGGYHCSVEDLRTYGNARDYSNIGKDDRDFNIRYGAAIDISLNKADMIKVYKRVYAVWKDKSDPRRKYINAINVWSGSGSPVRLNFVTGKASRANNTHTWHFHHDFRRRYVMDPKAGRAAISMYQGESKAAWSAREEAGTTPPKVTVPPKVVPKPVVKHAPGSRELRYVPGKPVMTGDDVAFVQRFIGGRAGTADGSFGARTRSAVIWYQRMRGLKADGVVGPATFRAMGVKNNL
jgi:peptidoglycan hydrolase-like protein with peptidoglycan-binding domain